MTVAFSNAIAITRSDPQSTLQDFALWHSMNTAIFLVEKIIIQNNKNLQVEYDLDLEFLLSI